MTSEGIGRNKEIEREQKLDSLERVVWALLWMTGSLLAAMLVAFVWVVLRGHNLDADMDVVAASLGGG